MATSSNGFRPLASTLAALVALGAAGTVAAQEDENPSGPYVGAGYGDFTVKLDSLEGGGDVLEDLDSGDSAFKVFFGWRFNPYFSLEADYVDLGAPNGNFGASGSS